MSPFLTMERMFIDVARNVIWAILTAAASAAVGHLNYQIIISREIEREREREREREMTWHYWSLRVGDTSPHRARLTPPVSSLVQLLSVLLVNVCQEPPSITTPVETPCQDWLRWCRSESVKSVKSAELDDSSCLPSHSLQVSTLHITQYKLFCLQSVSWDNCPSAFP